MTPPPRARYQSRREQLQAEPQGSLWSRTPRYLRVLILVLPFFIVGAAFHRYWSDLFFRLMPPVARLQVLDEQDQPMKLPGKATIFATDRSNHHASPMPSLGTVSLSGPDELEFAGSDYPKSIQVLLEVEGYGRDYISLEIGQRRPGAIKLAPPRKIRGRIVQRDGEPIADAEVLALGGGSRGVVLDSARTGTDGRYELGGVSERVSFVSLRVLKPGFALAEREHWPDAAASEPAAKTDFELIPVPPVEGLLRMPEDFVPSGLHISVLACPGVRCRVDKEGHFLLHHLEAKSQYRVLAQGLPEGFTQRKLLVRPGTRAQLEILPAVTLKGRVQSTLLRRGIRGVSLWHENTNRGRVERCITDDDGAFSLPMVPVGAVEVHLVVPDTHFGGQSLTQQLVIGTEPVDIAIK